MKDNIPTDRLPIVTLLLIAAGVVASLLVPSGGIPRLLASVLFLWIFGTNVEDAMSRPRFGAFTALGAAAAIGLALLLGLDATVEPVAAAGATAAAIGGYVRLYPRARIVSAVVVPFAFTLVEVPVWGWVGAWFGVQALFAATVPDGAIAFLAQGLAFAVGLLAIGAFAQRRKLLAAPPPPPVVAALP